MFKESKERTGTVYKISGEHEARRSLIFEKKDDTFLGKDVARPHLFEQNHSFQRKDEGKTITFDARIHI